MFNQVRDTASIADSSFHPNTQERARTEAKAVQVFKRTAQCHIFLTAAPTRFLSQKNDPTPTTPPTRPPLNHSLRLLCVGGPETDPSQRSRRRPCHNREGARGRPWQSPTASAEGQRGDRGKPRLADSDAPCFLQRSAAPSTLTLLLPSISPTAPNPIPTRTPNAQSIYGHVPADCTAIIEIWCRAGCFPQNRVRA